MGSAPLPGLVERSGLRGGPASIVPRRACSSAAGSEGGRPSFRLGPRSRSLRTESDPCDRGRGAWFDGGSSGRERSRSPRSSSRSDCSAAACSAAAASATQLQLAPPSQLPATPPPRRGPASATWSRIFRALATPANRPVSSSTAMARPYSDVSAESSAVRRVSDSALNVDPRGKTSPGRSGLAQPTGRASPSTTRVGSPVSGRLDVAYHLDLLQLQVSRRQKGQGAVSPVLPDEALHEGVRRLVEQLLRRPTWASRPPTRRMATWSPSLIASSMSWVISTMVLLISHCRPGRSRAARCAQPGRPRRTARPSTRPSGSAASARATPTRCCCPPESWAGYRQASFRSKPTLRNRSCGAAGSCRSTSAAGEARCRCSRPRSGAETARRSG